MNRLLIFAIIFLFFACNESAETPTAVAAAADLGGYKIEAVGNSNIQKASKEGDPGSITEDGYLLDGKRHGAWNTYYKDDRRVKTLTNYIDGLKNGVYLEFNDRGQVTLQAFYVNDQLDGVWKKFRFGSKREKEVGYKNGVMDGYYREYHQNGKLMKEVPYKNGKIHGTFKQYNDQEQLVMQYEYNMGEKVSGGIVTPEDE